MLAFQKDGKMTSIYAMDVNVNTKIMHFEQVLCIKSNIVIKKGMQEKVSVIGVRFG